MARRPVTAVTKAATIPLTYDTKIANPNGTPTEEFMRVWLAQRNALDAAGLSATGVTPGNYGDSTNVGKFTVDQYGRITLASNVAIAAGGAGMSPFWPSPPVAPTISQVTVFNAGLSTTGQSNTTRGFITTVKRGAGDRNGTWELTLPGATWTITALMSIGFLQRTFLGAGLAVRDSGSGRIQAYSFTNNGSGQPAMFRRINWNTLNNFNSSVQAGVIGQSPVWVRLQLTATDLIFSVSYDGEFWTVVDQQAKFGWCAAITHAGLYMGIVATEGQTSFGVPETVHWMSLDIV